MMREDRLENQSLLNKKGVTLIELLIVLVICAIVIGGIYKVFIAQTRAYTVQDQVAEVQQDVRGAMEIMVRDIRMAGFQNGTPVVTPLADNSITVNYQYITGGSTLYTVNYALVGGSLVRTLNGGSETLLRNVTNLNFSYGIDENGDKIIDGIDPATGVIPDAAFRTATYVNNSATAQVYAIRIILTANPDSLVDPDVTKRVSPRTLTSVVTPRNMFFKRYQAY